MTREGALAPLTHRERGTAKQKTRRALGVKVFGVLAAFLCLSLLHGQISWGMDIGTGNGLRLRIPLTSMREQRRQFVTFQEYDLSCGPAAISTLMNYYFGEPVTEKEVIATILQVSDVRKILKRRGFSLLDMKKFAQRRGYKALGYRMNFDFLVEMKEPVIVPIEMRGYHHFIVFKGISGDRVVVADPAFGNYTTKVSNFLSIWSGGIGFVLKEKVPKRSLEDFRRKGMFMPPQDLRALLQHQTPLFAPMGSMLQTIKGPRPAGGSFFTPPLPSMFGPGGLPTSISP